MFFVVLFHWKYTHIYTNYKYVYNDVHNLLLLFLCLTFASLLPFVVFVCPHVKQVNMKAITNDRDCDLAPVTVLREPKTNWRNIRVVCVCVLTLASRFTAVGDFVIMKQTRMRLGGLLNSIIRFFCVPRLCLIRFNFDQLDFNMFDFSFETMTDDF